MLYKNAELHNVETIVNNADGSISWKRVPENVFNVLEANKNTAVNSTGVELRFKMKSDKVVLKMATTSGEGLFHVYRGAIQGGWEDHEVHKFVRTQPEEYEIKRSEYYNLLKTMTEQAESEWNSEVIRVIFDRGNFKIFDIIGDIEPPEKEDCPKKTLFCYGSSITHGSNAIDISHSWASLLARELDYDLKNKGMAGSCCMEPEYADFIAAEGRKGNWDALIMELGINVLNWEDEKILERASYIIKQTASLNPDKPIFVISPFYHCNESVDEKDRAKVWRKILGDIVADFGYPNVRYINGLDILDNMTLISADSVHPNIYGVAQIAEMLTKIIKPVLCG